MRRSQAVEVTDGSDDVLSFRPRFFGARVERREDAPLLTGDGQFVADLKLAGMLDAAFVRSTVAHARILSVDLESAGQQPGVIWAASGGDLEGVREYPDRIVYQPPVHQFPLQRDRVRFVGAPVAVVVATDRYLAEDAAELVNVTYQELPAVTTIDQALAPDAPILFDDWPDNRVLHFPARNPDVDRIFGESPTVAGTYVVQRQSPAPMETRGVVAEYKRGRLSVWSPTQNALMLRSTLAEVLAIPERRIRVITPDVGGAFGAKIHTYPEEVLVPYLAMRLGRPIRWIEDRAEHMVSSVHARDQRHELEAAYDSEGRITAIRAHVVCDVGSGEISIPGTSTSLVTAATLTAAWKIPCSEVSVTCVVTNKTPSGAYRGFGSPEAVFAMERLIDKVAAAAGVDPIDARRRMMFDPDDLPYVQPNGSRIDSGSHKAAFERALVLGHDALARRRREEDRDHIRLGLGYCQYVEPTVPVHGSGFWSSHDAAMVRVDPDGGVLVACGVAAIGQGTESTIAALTADLMEVPIEQVTVLMGDTDSCPYGLGSWGSRSAVVFAGSVAKATSIVREKAKVIAAGLLEADATDVIVEEGNFHVVGSATPAVSWADVATTAYVRTMNLPEGVEPSLEASVTYDPPNLNYVPDASGRMNGAASWGNGSHSAVVSVDLETGVVDVLDYFVVHDCGRIINPAVVDGQIHGGVAQGIAGALYESIPYDGNGQPLATSFMDYLIPTATDVPHLVAEHIESPAPEMPFGIKGVGEGGTIGPPAVIAGGVVNALSEFGVDITETPITPGLVLRLLNSKRLTA